MKIMYAAISFLMALGIGLGIYTSSYNQFNINNASTNFSQTTEVVTQVNTGYANTAQLQLSGNQTNNSGTTNTQCAPLDIFCQIWSGIQSVGLTICGAIGVPGCVIFGGVTPLALELSFGNKTAAIQAANVANTFINQQTQSNNLWLKITGNPLETALAIMGLFLGLGVLAGVLGAGILARIMASVGIGLSMIVYIEASLTTFNNLPALVFIGFNGVVGFLLIVIAWEAFNSPGSATG